MTIDPGSSPAEPVRPMHAIAVLLAAIACLTTVATGHAIADELSSAPEFGIYYDRYEPAFYTGFAPRARDPRALHLHVGRGNQLRATLVLTDDVLETYARDLRHRHETYRTLVEQGRVVLTQNSEFELFDAAVKRLNLDQPTAAAGSEQRAANLDLLERLNPGRIFRIRIPLAELANRWKSELQDGDRKALKKDRALALLNALLPTRLWHAELTSDHRELVQALVKAADTAPATDFHALYAKALHEAGHGLYPVTDGREGPVEVRFAEFTSIYPIGSLNEFVSHAGRKIPLHPTPGRRALTTHQRTKTVDHIPDKVIYSYFPWIPYMHVGDRLHNSFHTLWWRMDPRRASFLPKAWHEQASGHRDGKTFRHLWLLSRGPMSHGCTHVNAGHISELRQLLPAPTASLYDVDTFHNKSHQYDVFDIDGDLQPEVMGVRYFIAYSLQNKRPHRLRAPDQRAPFYDWLYGGGVQIDENDRAWATKASDTRFVGRTARDGRDWGRLPLYEARYEPEHIQFYRMVDIPFARELRKVSHDYPFPRSAQRGAPRG